MLSFQLLLTAASPASPTAAVDAVPAPRSPTAWAAPQHKVAQGRHYRLLFASQCTAVITAPTQPCFRTEVALSTLAKFCQAGVSVALPKAVLGMLGSEQDVAPASKGPCWIFQCTLYTVYSCTVDTLGFTTGQQLFTVH